MNRIHIQMAGVVALTIVSLALLYVIATSGAAAAESLTEDGKVSAVDGGVFTAGLLALQQVVGAMRSIWESQERVDMATGLSNSVPAQTPNPPAPPAGEPTT
jgi:hypothetical protein